MRQKTGIFAYVVVQLCVLFAGRAKQSGDLYQDSKTRPQPTDPFRSGTGTQRLSLTKLKRQIDEYLKQGVQGAVVYPATNLKTPFLSEEWWPASGAEVLPYARTKGLYSALHPEFNVPNGDARDMWKDPPNQSSRA